MTQQEKQYVATLWDVAAQCGLEPEDMDPYFIEEAWDAIRAGEGIWTDDHDKLLVRAFDEHWTPEQVQERAVADGVWPPPKD